MLFVLSEEWSPHCFKKDIVINQASLRGGVAANK